MLKKQCCQLTKIAIDMQQFTKALLLKKHSSCVPTLCFESHGTAKKSSRIMLEGKIDDPTSIEKYVWWIEGTLLGCYSQTLFIPTRFIDSKALFIPTCFIDSKPCLFQYAFPFPRNEVAIKFGDEQDLNWNSLAMSCPSANWRKARRGKGNKGASHHTLVN